MLGTGWGCEEGAVEGGAAGAGGRGLSLMMDGLLLCEDLLRVTCIGVMKLDGLVWVGDEVTGPGPGEAEGEGEDLGEAWGGVFRCGVWGGRTV